MNAWVLALLFALAEPTFTTDAPIESPIQAMSVHVGTRPLAFDWSHALDDAAPSRFPQPTIVDRLARPHTLAIGEDQLFVAAGGAIVALDRASGNEQWHTGSDGFGVPWLSGDVLASATDRGIVHAFAITTGAERWRVDAHSGSAGHGYDPKVTLFGLTDGFLIGTSQNSHAAAMEVARDGHRLWSTPFPARQFGDITYYDGPTIAVHDVEDGAILHDVVTFFASGSHGGLLGSNSGVGPIATDGAGFWLGDAFIPQSNVAGVHTFDPRLPKERQPETSWEYIPLPGEGIPGFGTVAIEGHTLYARVFVGEQFQLFAYAFANPQGQRPFSISHSGKWIAGPYRGWNVILRADGVHVIRRANARLEDVHLMNMRAIPQVTAFDSDVLYVAFDNGRVLGLDLQNPFIRFDRLTSCQNWKGITRRSNTIVAACFNRVYVANVAQSKATQ